MIKTAFTAWLSLCLTMQLFSQDYGIQWVQGPGPMSVIDFRNDTITFRSLNDTASAFIGLANICDKEGNFLFFTNGVYVRDRYGNMLPDGDSLGYDPIKHSAFNSIYNTIYPNGAPNDQGVMILPKPGSNHHYYIFHFMPIDTSFIKSGIIYNEPTRFYYTVVDMNENFGLGAVVEKNQRLPLGLQCASRMTACKHANGRDWWIIRHGFIDSSYHKFLFTPDSIYGPYTQKIGPPFNRDGGAQDFRGTSIFNQEGTQMATANFWGPVVVLDFDRCSGEFSNPKVINNMLEDTTWYGASNLALSPNGRFLYAHNIYGLNQYDLWSANLNDSVRLYTIDSTDPYWLGAMQLAPNGKIYVSTWNGGLQGLHAINYPDSYGLACGFEFNAIQPLSLNTNKVPNMPNYKLGALAGSSCDTIVSSVTDVGYTEFKVTVSPNPASSMVDIVVKGSNENTLLTIYNNIGEVMGVAEVNRFVQLDVSSFTSGLYLMHFTTIAGKTYSTQIVVTK